MDDLPLELKSSIVALACEEDSAPARTLSYVSRHWGDVARPYLFTAVSVTGRSSIILLCDVLRNVPGTERRFCKLSVTERVCAPDAAAEGELAELIRELLNQAATTLESLKLEVAVRYDLHVLGNVWEVHFPRLTSLSLEGRYARYPLPSSPELPSLPLLKRLWLSGAHNPIQLFTDNLLALICPQLEELHIFGITASATFGDELEAAIHFSVPCAPYFVADPVYEAFHKDRLAHHASARLPPALVRLVVTAGAAPSIRNSSRLERLSHSRMVYTLNDACRRCEGDLSPLVFMFTCPSGTDALSGSDGLLGIAG